MGDAGAAAPAIEPETLKVGGTSAGHLRYFHGHAAPLIDGLDLIALAMAILYGAAFLRRPPSPLKTLVKTSAVAALAVASALDRDPWLLTLALSFCALGDAFLAGDPKRWLPLGLASFLAGHLAYVALFVSAILTFQHHQGAWQPGETLPLTAVRFAVMAGVVITGVGMLAWLWRSLGGLKAAVSAYVVAIVAMVCASLALPPVNEGAEYGALAFFASDAILSVQLFKQRFTGLLGQWAVWGLYFVGQLLILIYFSPLTF